MRKWASCLLAVLLLTGCDPEPRYQDVALSVWVRRTSDTDAAVRSTAIEALGKFTSNSSASARLREIVASGDVRDALHAAALEPTADPAITKRQILRAVNENADDALRYVGDAGRRLGNADFSEIVVAIRKSGHAGSDTLSDLAFFEQLRKEHPENYLP